MRMHLRLTVVKAKNKKIWPNINRAGSGPSMFHDRGRRVTHRTVLYTFSLSRKFGAVPKGVR